MTVGGGMNLAIKSTRSVQNGVDETGRAVTLVYPKDPTDPAWSDEDFGSAGGTLVAQYGMMIDLRGKGGRIRTVAVPIWVKQGIEAWTAAAKVEREGCFSAFEVGKDRGRRTG